MWAAAAGSAAAAGGRQRCSAAGTDPRRALRPSVKWPESSQAVGRPGRSALRPPLTLLRRRGGDGWYCCSLPCSALRGYQG